MKIKLPFVLRSTYERVVFELEKDLNVQEIAREAADKRVGELRDELYIKEQDFDAMKEYKDSRIAKLEADLEEANKKIQGMEWCIQERDKELKAVRDLNFKMYKKIEMASEMQRQVKDKIDTAFIIDFVTKKITPRGAVRTIKSEDVKKLSVNVGEDLVEIYTKIGMML